MRLRSKLGERARAVLSSEGASQAGERKGVSVHGTHFDAKPAQRLQTAAAQV